MQALKANAKVVLDVVPSVAITVLSVKGNCQAVIGFLFWRDRMTTIAPIESALMNNERISKAHDLSTVKGLPSDRRASVPPPTAFKSWADDIVVTGATLTPADFLSITDALLLDTSGSLQPSSLFGTL